MLQIFSERSQGASGGMAPSYPGFKRSLSSLALQPFGLWKRVTVHLPPWLLFVDFSDRSNETSFPGGSWIFLWNLGGDLGDKLLTLRTRGFEGLGSALELLC